MPFYLGLPIAIALWIAVIIFSLVAVHCVIDLRRNITSYNKELDKAVKRELERMKTQESNKGL